MMRIAPCAPLTTALIASPSISQQHGFVHASGVAAIAGNAAGYIELSLMPPAAGVLIAEFKTNLVATVAGERLVARGRVIKTGRTTYIGANRSRFRIGRGMGS